MNMSNTLVEIAGRKIAKSFSPTIVAEMSGNHNHSLDRALALVEAASNSGAHALKLQTYTADTITLDVSQGEFNINDEKNLWNGNNLYVKFINRPIHLGSGTSRSCSEP